MTEGVIEGTNNKIHWAKVGRVLQVICEGYKFSSTTTLTLPYTCSYGLQALAYVTTVNSLLEVIGNQLKLTPIVTSGAYSTSWGAYGSIAVLISE